MTDSTDLGDRMKDQKLRAVIMFEDGSSAPLVAKTLAVPLSTVYLWRQKWNQGGVERLLRWRWTHPQEPLTQVESEVLSGLMLGDGCLYMGVHARNACLFITRTAQDTIPPLPDLITRGLL